MTKDTYHPNTTFNFNLTSLQPFLCCGWMKLMFFLCTVDVVCIQGADS